MISLILRSFFLVFNKEANAGSNVSLAHVSRTHTTQIFLAGEYPSTRSDVVTDYIH